MATDVDHLEDGVFVAQVHIRDACASGGMACHAVIAWNDDVAVKVCFRLYLIAAHCILLFHRQFGRHFFFHAALYL